MKVCWPLTGFNNQFRGKIKTPFLRWLSLLGGGTPVVIEISRVALLTPHLSLQNKSYDLLNQITCSHFVWSIFILFFFCAQYRTWPYTRIWMKTKNIFVENKILNTDKIEPQNLPCVMIQAWFKNLGWRAINTVWFLYKYLSPSQRVKFSLYFHFQSYFYLHGFKHFLSNCPYLLFLYLKNMKRPHTHDKKLSNLWGVIDNLPHEQ